MTFAGLQPRLVGVVALGTLAIGLVLLLLVRAASPTAPASGQAAALPPPSPPPAPAPNSKPAAAKVGAAVRAANKVSSSRATTPRIFVSIPSYRDVELGHTLRSLFLHAAHPEAVTVGVYQQNAPGDPDGVAEYLRLAKEGGDGRTFAAQIKSKTVPHTQATGPTAARVAIERDFLANANADYVLMVDSHTLFLAGWDAHLVAALEDTDEPEFTVFSTYAPHYFRHERDNILSKAAACTPRTSFFIFFQEFLPASAGSFPRYDSRPCATPPDAAFPSLGWAAGFSFARASVHEEVPYVDLPWLFFGEEWLMHARLHTHGFDVMTPATTPLLTNFDRSYRPTFVQDAAEHTPDWKSRRAEATDRVRRAAAGQDNAGWFGDARSLDDFVDAVGVDLVNRRVDPVKAAGVWTDDPFDQAAEVALKHGSKAAFRRLRQRFE